VKEKRKHIRVYVPFGKGIKKIITREKLFRSFKEGLPLRSKTEQRNSKRVTGQGHVTIFKLLIFNELKIVLLLNLEKFATNGSAAPENIDESYSNRF
jgi:hypothetical protein